MNENLSILQQVMSGQIEANRIFDRDDIVDVMKELSQIANMTDQRKQLVEIIKLFELNDITTGVVIQHLLTDSIKLQISRAMSQFDYLLDHFQPRSIQ